MDHKDAAATARDTRRDTRDAVVPFDVAPGTPGAQVARPIGALGAPQGYWEYLPGNYDDGTPRPLLVFLHGVGENGNGSEDELKKVLAWGPPRDISRKMWPGQRPFVVLSPQHPGAGCPSGDEVNDFLTFALHAYHIDPRRIYLTGYSCGGFGTWNYLGQFRGARIAAAIPLAGDGLAAWKQAKCALGEVAIWAFHGEIDQNVPPAGDIEAMKNLIACPMPPRKEARFSLLPGEGHGITDTVYPPARGDIYEWMLRFTH